MDARAQVHATFTVPTPVPLFVVAVEILEGEVRPGMFLNIPLNPILNLTVRIASVAAIDNSWGLGLIGLTISCEDDVSRQIMDALNIGDEVVALTHDGVD